MLLKNKIIMITGIGPGMGSHLAYHAAAEGAKAIIQVSRSIEKMQRSEKSILKDFPDTQILNLIGDISNQQNCQKIIDASYKKFSRLDALINNAYAHQPFENIEDSNISNWQQVFDVNFFGSLYLSQAAILKMKGHGDAAIVMISTMASRKTNPGEAAYACSKAALNTATTNLAKEVGQYGIRVNTLAPGWMWGASVQYHFQMLEKQGMGKATDIKKSIEKDIPLKQMPTDEECAKAALFLISDYAKAVHGACLDANGGQFMAH